MAAIGASSIFKGRGLFSSFVPLLLLIYTPIKKDVILSYYGLSLSLINYGSYIKVVGPYTFSCSDLFNLSLW